MKEHTMADYSELAAEHAAAMRAVYRFNEPDTARMMELNGELARAIVADAHERGSSGPMPMKGHSCGSSWRPEVTRTCKGCLSRKATMVPLNAWAKLQDEKRKHAQAA